MNFSLRRRYAFLIFFVTGLLLAAPLLRAEGRYQVKDFTSVDQLEAFYSSTEYGLDDIREGQYVILKDFPKDFGSIRNVDRRKQYFQRIVLPLVYIENRRIHEERTFLKDILNKTDTSSLDPGTRDQLESMLDRYDMDASPETVLSSRDHADTLLQRVRQLPPSMVLAQAATESGWGTSRFCREGNNLFGERTYNDDAEGLKPQGVGADANFTVRTFPTLLDSVRSYMNNLNTHWAYEEFRRLRDEEGPSQGLKLVQALKKYSERKGDYVESIQNVIEYNQFTRFDGVVQ